MDILFGQLAKLGGVFGILCVIFMTVIGILYKALMNEKDERLKDAKQTNETITETLQKFNNILVAQGTTMDAMLTLLKSIDGKKL